MAEVDEELPGGQEADDDDDDDDKGDDGQEGEVEEVDKLSNNNNNNEIIIIILIKKNNLINISYLREFSTEGLKNLTKNTNSKILYFKIKY